MRGDLVVPPPVLAQLLAGHVGVEAVVLAGDRFLLPPEVEEPGADRNLGHRGRQPALDVPPPCPRLHRGVREGGRVRQHPPEVERRPHDLAGRPGRWGAPDPGDQDGVVARPSSGRPPGHRPAAGTPPAPARPGSRAGRRRPGRRPGGRRCGRRPGACRHPRPGRPVAGRSRAICGRRIGLWTAGPRRSRTPGHRRAACHARRSVIIGRGGLRGAASGPGRRGGPRSPRCRRSGGPGRPAPPGRCRRPRRGSCGAGARPGTPRRPATRPG